MSINLKKVKIYVSTVVMVVLVIISLTLENSFIKLGLRCIFAVGFIIAIYNAMCLVKYDYDIDEHQKKMKGMLIGIVIFMTATFIMNKGM